LAAGFVAVKMGLPVCLVAMVNENDIIHRTVQLGDFSLFQSVKHTLAPAIDIQKLDEELMEDFYSTRKLRLPPGLHKTVSEVVSSQSVTDRDIVETMRRCWEENHYLLCAHSAVTVQHHYQQQQLKHVSPRCCLANASAAKFQDAVLKAGLTPEIPAEIRALETMATHSTLMRRGECWEGILREKIELISSTWEGGNSV
ncbi:THNS2 protein, partial [Polyodon spathula]|nr:THNS2 protein [Polyodon spathula]